MSAALWTLLLATASCEKMFENESNCSTKVKLEFKKHRQALQSANGKTTDVFGSTVGSVHIFVFDQQSGELVLEKYESTQNLKSQAQLGIGSDNQQQYLTIDIEPGTYKIVAWCGLDQNDQNNAFELSAAADARAQQPATLYDLCSVKTSENGLPVNDQKYDAVYHGVVENAVVSYNSVTPIELTKDTNDIAVWVQHTSATFAEGDYEVVYTDANGTMRFDDNSLADSNMLEYHPHSTALLTSSTVYNGETVDAGALIAHISTSRLMAANADDARLEVRNRQGDIIFSIPLIKYVLELQTFTSDSQYYLDCEDTYNCSFYLTGESSGLWMPTQIIINNWVRVPDQTGSIGGE